MATGCSQLENSNDATILSGQVGKGKALAGSVDIWSQSGKQLGRSKIVDGKYSIDIKGYKGIVRVVASITKYYDEKLDEVIITSPIVFSAMSSISDKNQTKINITPITNIAYRLLYPNISSLSSKEITDTNLYVANQIGLGLEYNPTKGNIKYLNTNFQNTVQSNTSQNKEAWVLMTISNDCNLSSSDSPGVIKSKVDNAINNFSKAAYNKMINSENDKLDILYKKAFDDTGIRLEGIIDNNIVVNPLINYNISVKVISKLKRNATVIVNNIGTIQITALGDIKQGKILRANIIDEDGYVEKTVKYQWQTSKNKNGHFVNIINNSKVLAFLLTKNEVNKYIRVKATYTDNIGIEETVISNSVGPVVDLNVLGTISDITGNAIVNILLRAGDINDLDGYNNNANYQWQKSTSEGNNFNDINNANKSTYKLTQNELGKYIRVEVIYRDNNGTVETLYSNSIGPIINPNINTNHLGVITDINGSAIFGATITAGNITDQDGYDSNVTYQWKSSNNLDNNYENIVNATDINFTITQNVMNKYLKVVGTYTDNNGNNEIVTSNSIGPIKSMEVNLFTPTNGATAVEANVGIQISFNESIDKNNTKNIGIYTNDNVLFKNISLNDVAINENNATIVYNSHLKYGAVHYIKIDSEAFYDNHNNKYQGITDKTWSFTIKHGPCGCDELDNCDL
jgi:hypothetical protein